jgi:hypothetical protein
LIDRATEVAISNPEQIIPQRLAIGNRAAAVIANLSGLV